MGTSITGIDGSLTITIQEKPEYKTIMLSGKDLFFTVPSGWHAMIKSSGSDATFWGYFIH